MKKISKIKTICLMLVFMALTFTTSCSSCMNKYEEMKDGVTLNVASQIKDHLIQKELPSIHFDYNGVRVMMEGNGSACYFVQNDQYALSDKFYEHLKQYKKDQIHIVSKMDQEYDKGKAKFAKDKLPLDAKDEFGNEQKYSKEFQIVATSTDGTRYSYQFRTFVSNQKRYFIYRYTNNMGISMEQPLMVIKGEEGQNNKLLLIALPFDTKYEVGPNTIDNKALLEKDTYTKERYTKFAYPESMKDLAESVRREQVKSWYKTYCNGHETVEGDFVFEYYGATFKVNFGIKDAGNEQNKEGFQLVYLG